ncbi:cytochrome oxidase small assembly protein [Undibacterium sp. MH2W]|uniref:cytochrome oxidase small assembly protein n=1 Tax=Undibacterium sp. MH2W TaxID=3413044 RepID=UPI003BF02D1F
MNENRRCASNAASWKASVTMKNDQKKPNNLRTALILASVAVIFFAGVILKQTLRF